MENKLEYKMKKKKWKERPLMLTDSLTLLSSASKYDTQLVTREKYKETQ